ncbi:helitron_like_N domain-containing protein [Trichonephila clavipes]|nr:helitron_like_N domain-containing protein [Trichonephila clavipes]
MYSIEWQKRGLPHAHILVWLINKITPDQIDQIISAEIPDKHIDPNLFDVVTKNMIHGPCGAFNNNSPCMSDGKCTKRYPRKLVSDTITGNDGYPLYRRRSVENGGKSVVLKVRNIDIEVDNRWIVPYSPLLSKTFKAHINVECCNSVKSIKYICKYVNKGSDMAVFGIGNVAAPLDEINQYQLGRYISSTEVVWRILSFPIHERHPTVVHLAVHLENGQRVYFTADNVRARALVPPATTLTAFYSLCQDDLFAKTLLYSEVPKFYTWNASTKKFQRHKQDLRTVNGQLCATYLQACQELNLLEKDAHWDTALADASNTAQPQQMRTLFAIILTTCFPSNPKDLWEKYKNYMSEDILHRLRAANQNPDIQFTPNVYNEALILIEDICLTIANKALVQLGMTASNRPANNLFDRDLQRETHYDSDELRTFVRQIFRS